MFVVFLIIISGLYILSSYSKKSASRSLASTLSGAIETESRIVTHSRGNYFKVGDRPKGIDLMLIEILKGGYSIKVRPNLYELIPFDQQSIVMVPFQKKFMQKSKKTMMSYFEEVNVKQSEKTGNWMLELKNKNKKSDHYEFYFLGEKLVKVSRTRS